MAKFCDVIGYSTTQETVPGVWEDVIVEKKYYGDVLRNTRKSDAGESVNNDLSVSNSISVIADAYANEHFFDIAYIKWMGRYWTVQTVDAATPPRLIMRLGEVYNGPKA